MRLLPKIKASTPGLSVLVEICGIGCLVTAGWWFMPIVGLVVLGAGLIYVAQGI